MNKDVVVALIVAPTLVVGMAGIGGRILLRTGLTSNKSAWPCLPLATALGFACFSYAGYITAFIGLMKPAMILGASVACIFLGKHYWVALLSGEKRESWTRVLRDPRMLVLLVVLLGVVGISSFKWLTPTTEGDATLGYMFSARWIHSNGLGYSPFNSYYSMMPLGTELVFANSFAFGTDLVAKTMDGLFGLCLLLAVYQFALRYTDPPFALISTLSLATMPDFLLNWASGKVDIVSCLTFFCGLLLVIGQKKLPTSAIVLSAFLVGTACNQKYTIWPFAAVFPLAILIFDQTSPKKTVRRLALVGAVIVLCIIPHLVRNVALTNNPVAPFGKTFFPTRNVYLQPVMDQRPEADPMLASDLVHLPRLLFFNGQPRQFRLGPLPIVMLVGPLLFLFSRRKPLELIWVAIIGLVQLAIWIALLREYWLMPRYFLVPLILLLPASVYGIQRFCGNSALLRNTTTAIMAAVFVFGGIWPVRNWRTSAPVILGSESIPEWHARYAPHRGYRIIQKIAGQLGPSNRLLISTSLLYVPEDKLQYISTEAEAYEFAYLPEDRKLAFLREHNFAYYLETQIKTIQPWAASLTVVDRKEGRVGYIAYQVPVEDR